MSRYFEAFHKTNPDAVEQVLPEAPGPLVSGRARPETSGSPAAVPPVEIAAVPAAAQPVEVPVVPPASPFQFPERVRKVSIRFHAGAPVFPFDGTDTIAAERYRSVRTKLIQHPSRPKFLAISSSGIGDGKSITSINLAAALALKQEATVLLMECDFRRPSLAGAMGVPGERGLANVLDGECPFSDAVVQIEGVPNLYFLPAGEVKRNPVELLDSDAWRSTCAFIRKEFTYSILDCPPVGMLADYDLIQAVCDGVLIVARQDHTERSQLVKVLGSIPREKLVGVVVNCATDWFLWKTHNYYGYESISKPAGAAT